MPTPTAPREDVPTSSMPVPNPTHPVAGRAVASATPTFDWTPVPDADTYRLQLAASDDFETIYYDEFVDGPTTLSLAEVVPDGVTSVAWRVRAETGSDTPWSNPAHFDVPGPDTGSDEAQFLVDAPPVPIHPVEGDAVDARLATFTWEPVPEASGYQIQVGTSEAFDESVVDVSFDQVTSVTLADALPEKASVLCWRARALFPNDTSGPWSDPAYCETKVERGEEDVAEAPSSSGEASTYKDSPVAAGPAQRAHTSTGMAMAFVLVLVVSFVATILAIMWV